MHRFLFLVTLALYGFSAMDLHEWTQVPRVIVHLLEHHSDLGHHDEVVNGQHEHDGDHDPFDDGCHEEFCACGGPAFLPMHQRVSIVRSDVAMTLIGPAINARLNSYSGKVWNPPKQA